MRSLLISSKHGEKSSPFHLDATCVFLGGVAPAVLPMIVLFRAFADPIFACNVNATLNIQHFQTRNTKQESLLSKNKRNCGFDYHFVMHSKEYPLIVDGLLGTASDGRSACDPAQSRCVGSGPWPSAC